MILKIFDCRLISAICQVSGLYCFICNIAVDQEQQRESNDIELESEPENWSDQKVDNENSCPGAHNACTSAYFGAIENNG